MAHMAAAKGNLLYLETELTKEHDNFTSILSSLEKSGVDNPVVKQLSDVVKRQDSLVSQLRALANESITTNIALSESSMAIQTKVDMNEDDNDNTNVESATEFYISSSPDEPHPPPSCRPKRVSAQAATKKITHTLRRPPATTPNIIPIAPKKVTKTIPPTKKTRKITPRNSTQWNKKLEELIKYCKTHDGNIDIPLEDGSPHLDLARWIRRQRREYQLWKKNEPSFLNPERIAALEELNFPWVGRRRPNRKLWMQRFEQLQQYKSENGHCDVPAHIKDERYKRLSVWVTQQRTYHRFLRQGKPTMISPERIKMLDEVGFNWSVAPPQVDWDVRLNQLLEYKETHGHTNVPQKYAEIAGLGEWILNQRRLYRHHLAGERNMDPEKIKKLNDIGFQWSLRNRRSSGGGPGKKKEDNNNNTSPAMVPKEEEEEETMIQVKEPEQSHNADEQRRPPVANNETQNNNSKLDDDDIDDDDDHFMNDENDDDDDDAIITNNKKPSAIATTLPPPLSHHPYPAAFNMNESSEMRQTASFLAHFFENNTNASTMARKTFYG